MFAENDGEEKGRPIWDDLFRENCRSDPITLFLVQFLGMTQKQKQAKDVKITL
jgi:hypothetical protein